MNGNSLDQLRGALPGLASGDAIDTTLEFALPGTFEAITDTVGGGPLRLEPGQWTDDTSMALCLAESLARLGRFDPIDQLERARITGRARFPSNGQRGFRVWTPSKQCCTR